MESVNLSDFRYSLQLHRLIVRTAMYEGPMNDVYLSFDDGPHPAATDTVLRILRFYGYPATFFCTGEQVKCEPGLFRHIVEAGHSIGNHGYSHRALFLRGSADIREEIDKTDDVIEDAAGFRPRLFRPPYGAVGPSLLTILRELDKRLVLWSLDTKDYSEGRRKGFARRMAEKVKPGHIVLFHDNPMTADPLATYLPEFLEILRSRGMTFAPLPS